MTNRRTDRGDRPAVMVVFGVGEYQARLIRSVSAVFGQYAVPLIIYTSDPSLRGVPPLLERLLRREAPIGVITTPSTVPVDEEDLIKLLGSLEIPAVHIGQSVRGGTNVNGDAVTGMRALMTHLLDECGARRPVLVQGIEHHRDSVSREEVFRAELRQRGIDVDEDLVIVGQFVPDLAYQAMSQLLKRRTDMDAVVALNDSSAFGVLDALADAGLRVPDDVAVTGFDDDLAAAMRWPGLTTVSQEVEEQGAAAARLLLELARGSRRPADLVIPSRLITRGSTAMRGATAGDRLKTALDANHLMQTQLTRQDTLLALNRALFRCRTTDEVAQALVSCLNRLGIASCHLAVPAEPPEDEGRAAEGDEYARIILDYREGIPRRPPDSVFPAYRLLPEQLRQQLADGAVMLLPLTGLDRSLGYLLFEQVRGSATVIEVLRHDLSRALDSVFSAQERDEYTANLERLVAQRTRRLERVNAELQRSLMRDGLTGIANRTAFQRHLEHHWYAEAAAGRDLALLLVDVDLFKAYNDHYGHVLGDEALRTVAGCLERSALRPTDLAARYGGEEFVVVLPGSSLAAATTVAERFRALLAEAAIPHAASKVAPVVTASIGIAAVSARPEGSPGALVEMADHALYRAKATGRDRVCVYTEGDADAPADSGACECEIACECDA